MRRRSISSLFLLFPTSKGTTTSILYLPDLIQAQITYTSLRFAPQVPITKSFSHSPLALALFHFSILSIRLPKFTTLFQVLLVAFQIQQSLPSFH